MQSLSQSVCFQIKNYSGYQFLLWLLQKEIACKTAEFAHITCAVSSADKSPCSNAVLSKGNVIVIFLSYHF